VLKGGNRKGLVALENQLSAQRGLGFGCARSSINLSPPSQMELCVPCKFLQCLAQLRLGAAGLEVQVGVPAAGVVLQGVCRLCLTALRHRGCQPERRQLEYHCTAHVLS
jgi:hypothetical protein